MFTLFDNPSECRKCDDSCCRFHRGYTKYAPFFSTEEKNKLVKKGLLKSTDFKKEKTGPSSSGGLRRAGWQMYLKKWRKKSNYSYCPILDKKTKKCQAYNCRSLDCSLYPFLIMKNRQGKLVLGLDMECPVAKKANKAWEKDKKFTRQVKSFFASKKFKNYLKKHPGFVEEYIRDVKIVMEL